MKADARTYWDNQGILDDALTVALVRRDRPGLEYLPKIPPEAIMADVVLPGRPSDEELDADTSVTVQGLTLDASGGSARPGAADFFVVAAFSKWWVGPRRLRIEDSHARVRDVWDRPRPLDRTLNRSARRDEAPMGLSVRKDDVDGRVVLRASLRRPAGARHADTPTLRAEKPWLTVLGFHLRERGGATGGVFELSEDTGSADEVDALVPFSALAGAVEAGRWIFFVFIGGEISPPTEILLNDADVRR